MSTTSNSQQEDRDTTIARSVVYGLLSRALAHPSEARLAELRETVGPLAALIVIDDPQLGPMVGDLLSMFDRPAAQLRRAHTLTFPPIDSRDHPPYESAYVSSDIFVQTDVMADIGAFYRAHGLRAGGGEPERHDHICTELEFMAFMAHKQVCAIDELGADEVEECHRTQTTFLRDHLGRWAVAFGDRLAISAADEPYRLLGRLLRTWIELDCTLLAATPEAYLDRPHPPIPPDDGTCGFEEAECSDIDPMPSAPATPVSMPGRRGTSR
ncbi:MAG: molecular chaperone TorD family protein [Acidimicrobiales bacterium]|nr:molecular chaperone TorD family protein [Acidimicrobiales bacterium]